MIPETTGIVIGQGIPVIPARAETTRTYRIDFDTGRVYGFVEGTDAMKQAILKIIWTERFDYLIYSRNYGVELDGLIGGSFDVLASEVGRVIKEALLADSRVDDVAGISVTQTGRSNVTVAFTALTMFGDIHFEEEIEINV